MTIEQLASYDPLAEIRSGKSGVILEANKIRAEKRVIQALEIEKSNEVTIEVSEFLGIKYVKEKYNPYAVLVIDGGYFICAEPRDNKTYIRISKKACGLGFHIIEEYNWPYRGDFFFEKNYFKAKTKLKTKIRARLLKLLTENV